MAFEDELSDSYWDWYKSASPWWKQQGSLPPGPEPAGALPPGPEFEALPGGGGRALPPGADDFINAEGRNLGAARRALGPGATPLPASLTPERRIALGLPAAVEGAAPAMRGGRLALLLGAALAGGGAVGAYLGSREQRKGPFPPWGHPANLNPPEPKSEPENVGVTGSVPQPGAYIGKAGEMVFSNRPGTIASGTYDPNEGNRAAAQMRQFIEAKYGPGARYGGGAAYINDLERASAGNIAAAQAMLKRYPGLDIDKLFTSMVEEPQAEVNARMAGPLKELQAIDEQERQRRENTLMSRILARIAGVNLPEGAEGFSGDMAKKLTDAMTLRRQEAATGMARERLDIAKRRQDVAEGRPFTDSQIVPEMQTLLAATPNYKGQDLRGHQLAKMGGIWYVVDRNGNPVRNSNDIINDLRTAADARLRKRIVTTNPLQGAE